MKVLDIHPNYCWSFTGPDEKTIKSLRSAVEIADPQLRDVVLQRIGGRAFGFVGEAAKMEFAPRAFDAVNLGFTPREVSQRVLLRQCVRRWSKNKADLQDDTSQEVRWDSLWNRILGRLVWRMST